MPDADLSTPDPQAYDRFIQAQAVALRAKDLPPANRREWDQRRVQLRKSILAAIGPIPEKPCNLEPQFQGFLKRDGYRIERLIFQSRPDIWVTANAYVPDSVVQAGQDVQAKRKLPAVLVVHGHCPLSRRHPVIHAPCPGPANL